MSVFTERAGGIEWQSPAEVQRVEAWGPHGVRVRAAADAIGDTDPGALTIPPRPSDAAVTMGEDGTARLVNGRITVEIDAAGRLRFTHTASGRELVAEKRPYTWYPGPRAHAPHGDGTYRLEQRFEAYEGERIYGLGQHLHGRLDQKGCVIDLVHDRAERAVLESAVDLGLCWGATVLL